MAGKPENNLNDMHHNKIDDMSAVKSVKKEKLFQVNRKLLPIKGFYFFFLAAVGSLLPFIAIYMKHLGLTSSETGTLYGVMPMAIFFIRPLLGIVADHWHRHKTILMLCSILTGFFYLLILTIPARSHPVLVVNTLLDCNVQDSFFRSCKLSSQSIHREPCEMELIEVADFLNVSNSKDMNYTAKLECEASCIKRESHGSHGEPALCFTDDVNEFITHCNGTLTSVMPISFGLKNLSHLLDAEVFNNRIDSEATQCADYDLKDLVFDKKHYWQVLCDEETTLICKIHCRNLPSELCQSQAYMFDSTFGRLFVVYLLANLAFGPIFSLADAVTFHTLGEHAHKYGKQRLWGTIGFASLAITSTFVTYFMSQQGSERDYRVSFYIFMVLCCFSCADAYLMKISSNLHCGNMFRNIMNLLSKIQVLTFLVVVLHFGIVTGAIEGFLFWYLQDLGAVPLVFGLSLVINCIFEVPLLFFSGSIIKRVGSVRCLCFSLIALSIRLLCYSFLDNPWLVLLIEPLHGVTFGIMWASAANHASQITPPGMSATIQGLIGGIHFNLGKGIGSILTGFLFEEIGSRWTFRVYTIVSLALLLVYALLHYFVFRSPAEPVFERTTDVTHNGNQNQHPLLSVSVTTPDSSLETDTSG